MNLLDITTILFSAAALILSIITFFMSYIWEKKKETIVAYKELQNDLFHIYSYKNNEIEDFIDQMQSDEYKALSGVLASLEIFAIGVENKTYDFNDVYRLAHGYLDITLRSKLESILDYKFEKSEKEYYPYSRKLLKRMDDKTIKKKCKAHK